MPNQQFRQFDKDQKIGVGHFFVAIYNILEEKKISEKFQPDRFNVECPVCIYRWREFFKILLDSFFVLAFSPN